MFQRTARDVVHSRHITVTRAIKYMHDLGASEQRQEGYNTRESETQVNAISRAQMVRRHWVRLSRSMWLGALGDSSLTWFMLRAQRKCRHYKGAGYKHPGLAFNAVQPIAAARSPSEFTHAKWDMSENRLYFFRISEALVATTSYSNKKSARRSSLLV